MLKSLLLNKEEGQVSFIIPNDSMCYLTTMPFFIHSASAYQSPFPRWTALWFPRSMRVTSVSGYWVFSLEKSPLLPELSQNSSA